MSETSSCTVMYMLKRGAFKLTVGGVSVGGGAVGKHANSKKTEV